MAALRGETSVKIQAMQWDKWEEAVFGKKNFLLNVIVHFHVQTYFIVYMTFILWLLSYGFFFIAFISWFLSYCFYSMAFIL